MAIPKVGTESIVNVHKAILGHSKRLFVWSVFLASNDAMMYWGYWSIDLKFVQLCYLKLVFTSTCTFILVSPTNVQLQMGTLSWDLPALGDYFDLTNFTAVWKESSDSEAWTPLDDVDPHQTHFNINTSRFSSASGRYVYVAVHANYQGKCVTSKECRLDLRKGNYV